MISFTKGATSMKFVQSLMRSNKQKNYKDLFSQKNICSYHQLNKMIDQANKLSTLLENRNKIRLWSLEQLLPYSQSLPVEGLTQFFTQKSSSSAINVVVNKNFSTIQQLPTGKKNVIKSPSQMSKELIEKGLYRNLIEGLNESKTWGYLPNFYNILQRHQTQNFQGLYLLIGEYNDSFVESYPTHSYMTLEELCAIYPQKVPLSYRSRLQVQKIKNAVEKRLSKGNHRVSLNEEPKFRQIIIVNDKIKMWDEAIQIMLDELPIRITVPFHFTQNLQGFYKLNLKDFVDGFKTSHKIIHPNIPLEIEHENAQSFVNGFLRNLKANNNKLKGKFSVEVMDDSMKHINQGQNDRNLVWEVQIQEKNKTKNQHATQ